jgi:hypothetical protein
MRIKLEDGMSYGYGPSGERICRGAQMGRSYDLPDNPLACVKLRMERLRFVDGCYDTGGAYWGMPANLYCAWSDLPDGPIAGADRVRVFVRGDTRAAAKVAIWKSLPNATFYK